MKNRETVAEGTRVKLRPTVDGDLPFLFETWSNPDVLRNFNFVPAWRSIQEFKVWFDQRGIAGGTSDLTIISCTDGAPVGWVGFGIFSSAEYRRAADIALIIHPSCRGNGFGSAALELSMGYAFGQMACGAITAGVYEFNDVPAFMLEKLGFKRTPALDVLEESKWGTGSVVQKTYILEPPTRQ